MNKTIKLKLEGLVVCYMLLTRLEELGRTGHIVHKDKQIINRTIKHLKRKETLIDMLDDEIPEDLDIIIAEFEHLLSALGKLKYEHFDAVYNGINEQIGR